MTVRVDGKWKPASVFQKAPRSYFTTPEGHTYGRNNNISYNECTHVILTNESLMRLLHVCISRAGWCLHRKATITKANEVRFEGTDSDRVSADSMLGSHALHAI